MIKIDKNIPLPANAKNIHSGLDEAIAKLKVGESCLLDFTTIYSFRSTLSAKKKGTGKDFTTRVEGEKVRIWRTK